MGMSMADKSRTMSGYDDGCHDEVNPKVTELRLGLPGTEEDEPLPLLSSCLSSSTPSQTGKKRGSSGVSHDESPPPSKAQIIGWPPVRSYRKNSLLAPAKKAEAGNVTGANNNNPHQNNYVKVSMDGAPYLRKIDHKLYKSYQELLKALEDMFDFTMGDYSDRGSEYAPTYEDKDGDWMLVGDVPWNMFVNTCKRLRIMKGGSRR